MSRVNGKSVFSGWLIDEQLKGSDKYKALCRNTVITAQGTSAFPNGTFYNQGYILVWVLYSLLQLLLSSSDQHEKVAL